MPRLPRRNRQPGDPALTGSGEPGGDRGSLEVTVARAVENSLVRGGLTITAGIVAGNVLGFARVAVTAYLLGTGTDADALAVAIGPLDTLNQVLISSMIYAFVPMLTAREGAGRAALFLRLRSSFTVLYAALAAALLLFAPWVIGLVAPGLAAPELATAAEILRIGSVSTLAIGVAAIHTALLYTDRRFGPTAFHQATINVFTLLGALILWKTIGVHAFAAGYAAGACVQLGIVYSASLRLLRDPAPLQEPPAPWLKLVLRPASILLYSALIALNVTLTRAYATHLGPGTAAAFEYCMRCIGVPLAFLISPASNSMLPEISRLWALGRAREAFRLADRTLALVAGLAVAGCLLGIAVREPVIALLFERGSFTADSTRLVSAVFLGFAPVLIGWSLLELTSRSVFALDRTALPLAAAAISVLLNFALLPALLDRGSQFLGVGASAGFLAAFAALFLMVRARRQSWTGSIDQPGFPGR
jgi:putative peptidoglycan lipid II flippase